MKLLCIGLPKEIDPDVGNEKPKIAVGQIYTYNDEEEGMYELKEHLGWAYAKKLFIPLSKIDEKKFERNYNKELI